MCVPYIASIFDGISGVTGWKPKINVVNSCHLTKLQYVPKTGKSHDVCSRACVLVMTAGLADVSNVLYFFKN